MEVEGGGGGGRWGGGFVMPLLGAFVLDWMGSKIGGFSPLHRPSVLVLGWIHFC